MIVIDGGFSKAYQLQTGIAGYTLIYNSHGLQLISHNHFESRQMAIEKETDIDSTRSVVTISKERLLVEDTDIGKELKNQIFNLKNSVGCVSTKKNQRKGSKSLIFRRVCMYVEKKSKKSLKIADVVMMIAFLLSILYFLVEAILGGMIPYKYILIMGNSVLDCRYFAFEFKICP